MSQGEIQTHPTEMSRGENGSDEEALQRRTLTIVQKIGDGAQKTESFFSSAFIYRVPDELRQLKESAYTPRLIAIGPLHREDKHFQTPFQHVKMSYTNHLLSRLTSGIDDPESAEKTKFVVVQECLAELKTLIDEAKKCYAEEVTLDEEMMLVDGCFILELLYGRRTKSGPKTNPICVALSYAKVKRDLVLLENQIPFIVLEELFQLTVGRIPNRPDKDWSLTDYVRWFYAEKMMPGKNSNNNGSAKSRWCSPSDRVLGAFGCTTAPPEGGVKSGKNIYHHRTAKYHHILHNLHYGFLPRDQPKLINFDFREMPSASELVYAGVKFVPDTGNDLFKFKFSEPKGLFRWCHRARFEIPPLVIDDDTESYLRNLIALEQCCPGVLQHVSSYAHVMDTLVNTSKDIQVLEKAGVLRNYLGAAEDATDLFNKLCKEIALGEYFADTCSKATKYSNSFWPKNMAHVRRTYFKSPWTFIAFCVGFIIFIMAVLQFVRDFCKKSG